jgi:hypothetical protein
MNAKSHRAADAPRDKTPRDSEATEHPEPEDWREPGGEVKEPPLPGTASTEERFPRKGEI